MGPSLPAAWRPTGRARYRYHGEPAQFRGSGGALSTLGFHGVAKFESLNGVDMRAGLMERIRPTPADVRFLNDADAFGLGELRADAASGHERAVVITLGTGVGSAFLAAGSVIDDDPSVLPEGRLDLLAIDGRPLEDTVSRRAILTRYPTLTDDVRADVDVRDLAERARAGEPFARRVFDDSMRALGEAIGPWLSAFYATALVRRRGDRRIVGHHRGAAE